MTAANVNQSVERERKLEAALREIRGKAERLPFANEPYEVAADIERIASEALS